MECSPRPFPEWILLAIALFSTLFSNAASATNIAWKAAVNGSWHTR